MRLLFPSRLPVFSVPFGLVLAVLSGCSLPNPIRTATVTPINHCGSNADCTAGVCDTQRHQCVATARADVFFRSTPTQGISATAFPTVTPVQNPLSGDAVDITLRAPHTVYGEVLAASSQAVPAGTGAPSTAGPIVATVQFVPSDPIYGPPVEVTASSTVASPINHDTLGYSYSTLLSDGTYNVLVSPAPELSGSIPPWFQQAFTVGPDAPVQRYDLRYPTDYVQWSGVVADPTGEPLAGLTVQCVDPARGDLPVSTLVTTDATGTFRLHLAPGAPDVWTLKIVSATNARAQLTVEIPRAVLDSSGYPPQALRVSVPIDTAWLPPPGANHTVDATGSCAGCVAVQAAIEGPDPTGASVPVRGADVVLHGTVPMPGMDPTVTATYEAQASTGPDGSFTASLIPGNYTLVVSPEDGVYANAVLRNFVVRSDVQRQAGQVFTLAPRYTVTGRALTPAGVPVAGATVTAVPFQSAYTASACLSDADMAILAPLADTTEVPTDTGGNYALAVNPGLYRLVVQPAGGSGFPATLSNPLCVASGVQSFDVALDAPVVIHGTVRDTLGNPIAGATVEGLIRVRDPGAPGVVLRLGRTVSATDGTYTTLLPDDSATVP